MTNVFEAIQSFLTARVDAIPANMYNEWFGSGAVGTPQEAGDTVAAIYAAVAGGYTLQTFTSSDAAWSVPPALAAATEAYAIAVNGGGKGMPGGAGSGTFVGGVGGTSGGYSAERIDPSTLASTLNVTVGAAASSNGADGGNTSIVSGITTLVHAVVGVGSVSTVQGYVPSNSMAGAGGDGGTGGNGVNTNGDDGASNAFAAGGGGGTLTNVTTSGAATGGAGSSGGAGQTSSTPLSAGAGGGGGGGCRNGQGFAGSATGGTGGNGGFPGGGSGGGGGASSSNSTTAGPAGTPGNGLAALLWK